jgi:LPS sulfotransferase NodH
MDHVPVKKTGDKRGHAKQTATSAIRHYGDVRLDFSRPGTMRKSYIVASAQRCGSTFLCNKLWQTGVLGAPAAYFQNRRRPSTKTLRDLMMVRLKASSAAEYLEKLLAVRTSANGVFGMKAHVHDFEAMLSQNPEVLSRLSPVTYIYVDRANKLAQAVSLAMALQTDTWSTLKESRPEALRYDKDLIAKCLEQNEQQELAWHQWFKDNAITPFHVTYEDLIADTAAVVRHIKQLLDVDDDEPEEVPVPAIEKQGDETNMEWIARYQRETQAGDEYEDEYEEDESAQQDDRPPIVEGILPSIRHRPAPAPTETAEKASHGFDRVDRCIKTTPAGQKAVTGVVDSIRWRYRYEAIIAQNRTLFQNARVLDIQGIDGRWSLAALEAGASHVVCVENRQKAIDSAKKSFTEYGAKPESYRIVNAKIFAALRTFNPGEFDLILCKEFVGQSDPRLFFNQLRRLRAKHVILDAAIARGTTPIAAFKLGNQAEPARNVAGRLAPIIAVPNHELIMLLCDYFGFQWRLVDWRALGITDWTGLHDYERGSRRTYVLNLTSVS